MTYLDAFSSVFNYYPNHFMTKVLFITIGGSHQPVVTSIKTQKPDRIIFICSDGAKGSKSQIIGDSKPCQVRRGAEILEELPNIPIQLELGDRFAPERDMVLIAEPDDLSECYNKISQKIYEVRQENSGYQMVADYTGGTKTMSVALATASLDNDVLLFITTSTTRPNLIKVESGERTRRAQTIGVTVTRTIDKTLPMYLESYNYGAAIAEMSNLMQTTEMSSDSSRRIAELLDQCEGFDAWDRFDHRTALLRLQPYMKLSNIQPYGLFLKKAIASRGQLEQGFDVSGGVNGHGYEVVDDLLLNANRRASQQRYDDAVGRLYRAIELLEQIRLFRNYGILTIDVDVQKLPEELQGEYAAMRSLRSGKVQIGLFQSYELLSQLGNDPLGELFLLHREQILHSLEVRNNSLLAHGFAPVNGERYMAFYKVIGKFIQNGIAAVIPANSKTSALQFPQSL